MDTYDVSFCMHCDSCGEMLVSEPGERLEDIQEQFGEFSLEHLNHRLRTSQQSADDARRMKREAREA
jgi:hypothetical protein